MLWAENASTLFLATTDLRLNIRNLADKRYVEYVSDASNVIQ